MIGKDAKDVSKEEALDYVAAYTCGNDVSSRKLQRDPAFAGGVPQWGFSKGFDTFAPLGPVMVSTKLIPDPSKLHMRTIIDGEVRQDESVSDLLFDSAYLISYLSQGTTIEKGTVIMTGTPGGEYCLCDDILSGPLLILMCPGVGAGFSPPKYLKPGNIMEVEISEIGTLRNEVVFA